MPSNDHWIYQGRQAHGWFGTGTAPTSDTTDVSRSLGDLFRPSNAAARVDYAASTLVALVPRGDRRHSAATFDAEARFGLKTAVAAWYGASRFSHDRVRAALFDPYTSNEVIDDLRHAATHMVDARSHADLGMAGLDLANAVQRIGLARISHRPNSEAGLWADFAGEFAMWG